MPKWNVTVPGVEVEAETMPQAQEMALQAIVDAVTMGKLPEATEARPETFEPENGKRFYLVERAVSTVVCVPSDADKWDIRIAASDKIEEDFTDADITQISREEYESEGGENLAEEEEEHEEQEDTPSLEDRGLTLGSYES